MGAARDEISATLNRLEHAMRQQGAMGERLGELARDLSRRYPMPRTVAKAIREVDSFSLRAMSPAAKIDELALGLWHAKVDHIFQWLSSAPSTRASEPSVDRLAAARPLLSWLEPWMLVAVLFLLGCGWALIVKFDVHLLLPAQRTGDTTAESGAATRPGEQRPVPRRATHQGGARARSD